MEWQTRDSNQPRVHMAVHFDAVLRRFGFMFFPDVDAAASELVRVARPGARATAAVWGPAGGSLATTVMGTIARHVGAPAPDLGAPGLFRCAGDGYLRQVFTAAGLRDITEDQVTHDAIFDQCWPVLGLHDLHCCTGRGQARPGRRPDRATIRAEVMDQLHSGPTSVACDCVRPRRSSPAPGSNIDNSKQTLGQGVATTAWTTRSHSSGCLWCPVGQWL